MIQSLTQHDCSAALAWCDANRARLKKAKSSLEFKLRLQEFLELVAKVSRPWHMTHGQLHTASSRCLHCQCKVAVVRCKANTS